MYALLTNAAQAEEPKPDAVTLAGAEQPALDFQRGLEALQSSRYFNAIAAFKAAYAGDHHPAALLNLGIAYTNAQQPHAAVQALDAYVSEADAQADAEVIAAARGEIERLRSLTGSIVVHLTPEQARLELDGEPVTLRDGELLATLGKHRVSAFADGYARFEQSLDVQAGQQRLDVALARTDLEASAVAKAAPAAAAGPAKRDPKAAAQASTAPARPAADGCLLAPVCLGPVATLGVPNVVGGGIYARWDRYVGIGVEFQALPTVTFRPISFGSSLLSANVRVHPMGTSFFVSGGFGYQWFHGQSRDGEELKVAKVSFPALTLGIGVLGRKGFVTGIDLGILFPLGSLRGDNEIAKVMRSVPFSLQLNLLRFGYMF